MDETKYSGNLPCFVKVFIGFDTGGQPIFETKCICPTCLGSTCPVHIYQEETEDEHSES
jgi:hypothetical protein